jgi:hypothetical protein
MRYNSRDALRPRALPIADDLVLGPPPGGATRSLPKRRRRDDPPEPAQTSSSRRSREELTERLWPRVRHECTRALRDAGFQPDGPGCATVRIVPDLTGVILLRSPTVLPEDGTIEIAATCGIRIDSLERLYDQIAGAATLRWYTPDPARHTFYRGFSEYWTFRADAPPEPIAARMGALVAREANAFFDGFPDRETALEAILSHTVVTRLDPDVLPLAMMLVGRFNAARDYLAAASTGFAWHEDADDYRAYARALMRHMGPPA